MVLSCESYPNPPKVGDHYGDPYTALKIFRTNFWNSLELLASVLRGIGDVSPSPNSSRPIEHKRVRDDGGRQSSGDGHHAADHSHTISLSSQGIAG